MQHNYLIRKTTIVSIIGVFLFVTSSIPAQAEDLQQQLKQSQQQANQLNGVLTEQKAKVAGVTSQVLTLKQSVQTLNNSIAREQVKLNEEQKNLKNLEDQQLKLEKQREDHIEALGKVLKNNYEEGINTYLAVLFEATNLADFLDRAEKIQLIIDTYGKLRDDLIVLNETLNSQKELINLKKVSIQAAIRDKNQTQQSVQQVLDKQQAILAQLSTEEKATLNSALSAQAKVSRIQKLIEQEKLEAAYAAKAPTQSSGGANSGGGVAGTVHVSGGVQQILDYAAQLLGTPYVWGGTTASPGFDCSGYTQSVYNHFGIKLNRTSEQQYSNGVAVSQSDLSPGDLVFFHTYSSGASHVGIYIGKNTMINSSSGGVSYDDLTDSYWSKRYLGARRVIAP